MYNVTPTTIQVLQRHGRDVIVLGVSRKLATSVNQGDKILTMMDVLKCTQLTLLKSY